jgi:DNA primase
MIPKGKVDEIIEAAHIEDVVGTYVSLKRRGANLLGLCPFHNEKTPSFNVSPSKGIYKCFGCGKAGNSISFIMEYEHLDFVGSLRFLAEKYNIEIPDEQVSHEHIQQEKQRQLDKESLQILNNAAMDYFMHVMANDEEGQNIGHSYFEERGFREETIQKFKLGYAKEAWDHFYEHAKQQGFSDEMLIKSGLVKQSENGKIYDAYRARVIFPIHGLNGKPIAFAGRILKSKDEKSPKYVNSPETELYHKSNELYGLYHARQAIAKQDAVYLVEGYTDVISLHQSGIEHVVASSGTSLTENQIKLIKRFTNNVCVLYDGDTAGIKASLRGVDMLLEAGLNIKIVLFPDGEDPDSYCKKLGPLPFNVFLEENRKDFILFKTDLLKADAGNDPIKKAELIRDIVQSISKIPDAFKRSNFFKECSRLLGIEEQLLVNESNKILRNKASTEARSSIPPPAETVLNYEEEIRELIDTQSQDSQEKELLKLILRHGEKPYNESMNVANFIFQELHDEQIEIENPVIADILKIVFEGITNQQDYLKGLVHNEDPKMRSLIADMLTEKYELSPQWESRYDIVMELENEIFTKHVDAALLMIKIKHNEKLIHKNQEDFNQVTSDSELTELIEVHKHLLDQRVLLTRKMGTVIIR